VHKKVAIVALIIILGLVNWSIATKEKHLAEGKIVFLELAPVDPRSLMQGDYMALRFSLANDVYTALPKSSDYRRWRHDISGSDGYVIASLDDRNIGMFKSLYENQTLAENDILMRYRVRDGAVKFATNAFFFQEGHGKFYEQAKYGQFRVDKKGELLLVAMFDKDLIKVGPNQ
jgi:uncharacterized membrane-anchored protein